MIGQQLGNYRIVRQLGKGGMAGVFVGEHVVLGHEVAVKILHPQFLEDERMRQRFLNEARTVAKLKHPSIVDVHDFGYRDDGSGYIVMERLEGQSLGDRLDAGPIPLESALELTRQIARALQVAHANGVVHRDLKPDNVFLVKDPETATGERAIVLDFGLAKHVETGGLDKQAMAAGLTASGFVVGTPAYMSPEQCRGADDLDGRADIYSLGIMLYRMCAGALPFDADNPGEMLGQHLFVEPPSVLTKVPELPRTLDLLLLRCMAKHPDDRWSSMEELADALSLDKPIEPAREQPTAAMRKAATAAMRKPAAVALPGAHDATEPAFVSAAAKTDPEPIAHEPTAPEFEPPVQRKAGWLAPLLVIAVLGAGGAAAFALWPRAAASNAAVMFDAAAFDAAPSDAGARDGALDAAPMDAALPDAAPPDAAPILHGSELARFVIDARNKNNLGVALDACLRGVLATDDPLAACTAVACQLGEANLARGWAARIRRQPTRDRLTRTCLGNGIVLD